MKAIVLSGGGAKGAYQVGAWKALKKLHIHYDIVTGTSIGAMNGMFFVQKEYRKCYKLWKNIDFSQIYDDFNGDGKLNIYKSYVDHMLKGGMKIHKIENLIDTYYNPNKLYKNHILYGVVAMNLTERKPIYATNQNMLPNQLKEYIMASATCFPLFEPKKIDGEKYIDGGYYDNMPINLAIDLGADEVIAINLEAIGVKRKVKNENVKIIEISPNNKIDSFLMFEKNASLRMYHFGYNDTMKKFGRLEGYMYTFTKGTISNQYNRYKEEFLKNISTYVEKPTMFIQRLHTEKQMFLQAIVEDSLDIFEVDASLIYNSRSLQKILKSSFEKVTFSKDKTWDDIKLILNHKVHVRYLYDKIKQGECIHHTICNLFHKEVLIAIYLWTIERS